MDKKIYNMPVNDSHLYFVGEEITTYFQDKEVIAEVVSVRDGIVSFVLLNDGDQVVEELIYNWKQSFGSSTNHE